MSHFLIFAGAIWKHFKLKVFPNTHKVISSISDKYRNWRKMYQFLIWGLASIPSPVRNNKEEKERCVVDASIRLVWWLWKDKTYFYFQTWYFLLYCRFILLIKSFNYQSKFYLSVLSRKFRELLSKKLPLDRGLELSQTNALVTSKLQLPPTPAHLTF